MAIFKECSSLVCAYVLMMSRHNVRIRYFWSRLLRVFCILSIRGRGLLMSAVFAGEWAHIPAEHPH